MVKSTKQRPVRQGAFLTGVDDRDPGYNNAAVDSIPNVVLKDGADNANPRYRV